LEFANFITANFESIFEEWRLLECYALWLL
jgi:hypothetical protein